MKEKKDENKNEIEILINEVLESLAQLVGEPFVPHANTNKSQSSEKSKKSDKKEEKEEKEDEDVENEEKKEKSTSESKVVNHILEDQIGHYVLKRLLINLRPKSSEFACLLLKSMKDLPAIAATNRGAFVLSALIDQLDPTQNSKQLRTVESALKPSLKKYLTHNASPTATNTKKSKKNKKKSSEKEEQDLKDIPAGVKVLMEQLRKRVE